MGHIHKHVVGFICSNDDISRWSNDEGFNRMQLSFIIGVDKGYLARCCRDKTINIKVLKKLRTLGFKEYETFDRKQPEQMTIESEVNKSESSKECDCNTKVQSADHEILERLDVTNLYLCRIADAFVDRFDVTNLYLSRIANALEKLAFGGTEE